MSAIEAQDQEGIRTPPPSYDDVIKSEKLPSYKSVEVEPVVTTQPRSEPVLRPERTENQPRCGDLCEPYYDEKNNCCLVCFFCNVCCWPLAACGDGIEDACTECFECCCGVEDSRQNRNRHRDRNRSIDNVDYATVNNVNDEGTGDFFCCCNSNDCVDTGDSVGNRGDYWINDDGRRDDDDGGFNNVSVNQHGDRNDWNGDTDAGIGHHHSSGSGHHEHDYGNNDCGGNNDTGNDGGGGNDTCTSDWGGGDTGGGGDCGGGDTGGGGDCGGGGDY